MARKLFVLALACGLLLHAVAAQNGCGGACSSDGQCKGQLACMSGKCGDDPGVGTHICSSGSTPSPSPRGISSCTASSDLVGTGHSCNTQDSSQCCVSGQKYPQYHCSPPVSSSTKAILTLNSFQSGADGGAASECDGQFHSDSEYIVALSTGWYNGGSRCLKQIKIFGPNGKSVLAKVVDECDSVNGCDSEHDYQPPCPYNDVDASAAVWNALGVSNDDPNYGMMSITWQDAA